MSWLRRNWQAKGYVTAPAGRARIWHTDPNCASSTWPKRSRGRRVTVRGATAYALADDLGARGVTPCRRCARPTILDEVAAGATKPGYHALICDSSHAASCCVRCADLTEYAAAHAYLVAEVRGHVGVLRPGVTALADDGLAVLWLEVRNAWGALGAAITAPMWTTAANLLPEVGTLTAALAAAVALYATPATGDKP